ncbi:50S ribosomal protein L30 [Desulfobaculum senezii]|jgi:large subunit ribosomal protein L30|uniref:50S ribosomal protein L30 n=1 Tax=Desulfobaculum sp. SPO524 TaxID=3378071 RepID=UPI003852C93F
MDKIKVRLVRSLIGCTPKQRKTVAALGLRKIRQVNELPKNDSTLGQIKAVHHLVEVVE